MVLDTESEKLMIINTYFPQDPKTVTYELDSDMEDALAVIENMMDSYQCNNVLIVGDLNTDFIRKNGRVKRFDMFLSSNTLESSWKKFDVDYTHEFENNGLTYTSTINRILWNEYFRKNVKNSGVLHLPENTSDHSPIFCNIRNICESSTPSVEQVKKNKLLDACINGKGNIFDEKGISHRQSMAVTTYLMNLQMFTRNCITRLKIKSKH